MKKSLLIIKNSVVTALVLAVIYILASGLSLGLTNVSHAANASQTTIKSSMQYLNDNDLRQGVRGIMFTPRKNKITIYEAVEEHPKRRIYPGVGAPVTPRVHYALSLGEQIASEYGDPRADVHVTSTMGISAKEMKIVRNLGDLNRRYDNRGIKMITYSPYKNELHFRVAKQHKAHLYKNAAQPITKAAEHALNVQSKIGKQFKDRKVAATFSVK